MIWNVFFALNYTFSRVIQYYTNTSYSMIKGGEYEVTNEWKGCGYGHKADPLI